VGDANSGADTAKPAAPVTGWRWRATTVRKWRMSPYRAWFCNLEHHHIYRASTFRTRKASVGGVVAKRRGIISYTPLTNTRTAARLTTHLPPYLSLSFCSGGNTQRLLAHINYTSAINA